MKLRTRLLIVGALLSVAVAWLLTSVVGSMRSGDLSNSLEQVTSLLINDQSRERCEADPQWFLTGTLEGRPKIGTPKPTDPDAYIPRAKAEEHPFELYAYDEQFIGSSTAAPRFPPDMKLAMRAGSTARLTPFATPDGPGFQLGITTGWTGGPCAIWLARMRPDPRRGREQAELFVGIMAIVFATVLLAGWTTTIRLQRISKAAREAAKSEYSVTVPATGHDEITAIGASFNEASADIRRRITDVKDREDAHRRFVTRVGDDLAAPLDALGDTIAGLGRASAGSPAAVSPLLPAIRQASEISSHLSNLLAGARLRMRVGPTAQDEVDVAESVRRAVARYATLAKASGVSIQTALPPEPIAIVGDAVLLDRAIGNLLENAIRFNHPGGHVNVRLAAEDGGKFSLRVIDDGAGVTDEQLTQLMAVRRFRGDEGKGGAGKRGLGLALVWEIAGRCQFNVVVRHASGQGLAVEMTGKVRQSAP